MKHWITKWATALALTTGITVAFAGVTSGSAQAGVLAVSAQGAAPSKARAAQAKAKLANAKAAKAGKVGQAGGAQAKADEGHDEHAAPPAYEGALGNSKMAALLFWVFALGAVGGAMFVITRRNMIVAVMGMVGTFFALAGLYAMLYAHFLAVIQILVYAGAIMVLFVFVIMVLNAQEQDPWPVRGLVGKGIAGAGLGYFLLRVVVVLWGVKDAPSAKLAAPVLDGTTNDFGSTRSIAGSLFTDYLFPFEAVSVVLLVAVVGAIAVARPSVTSGAQKEIEGRNEGGTD